MKLVILIVLLLFPTAMFPARWAGCSIQAPLPGILVAGHSVAGDTVVRDTGWMARVRRSESVVIRGDRSRRKELLEQNWTIAEIAVKERESREREAAVAAATGYCFALRANLLRWVTLTPDIGVEWRVNRRWGVTLDGMWTSWSWQNADRRYATWHVSPGVRYYFAGERVHAGAELHAGKFNYKLGSTGRQGNYLGGGLTAGYRLPLNRSFALDFSAGLGYSRVKYDKYRLINHTPVEQGSVIRGRWGVNSVEVSLEFKI